MIEVKAISGYEKVGRNMTALRVDDKVIIFDMGIDLENYIKLVGEDDISKISVKKLKTAGAIPEDSFMEDWKDKVKAIVLTHSHLDHIGAVPFLASKYKAPIIGTPYTIEVLKKIIKENFFNVKNEFRILNPNSHIIIDGVRIEFVNATHSTPQTVMVSVKTDKGYIVYANDYKLDNYPVLGRKTNMKRLRAMGEEGVLALIMDSTRAREAKKTPSEAVARDMLRDVLLGVNHEGKLVVVTTFSSHLARLKSIVHFAKLMNREVVFLGRSLFKYCIAGDDINLTDFSKKVKIIGYGNKIRKFLERMNDKDRGRYILVMTGHQGEPNAVLSKIAFGKIKFKFNEGDAVIFSCRVIPTETNIENRKYLDEKLLKQKVRVFKDIHVSGHGCKEDARDLIDALKPKYVIPSHGSLDMRVGLKELALEMGYPENKVILMDNHTSTSLDN